MQKFIFLPETFQFFMDLPDFCQIVTENKRTLKLCIWISFKNKRNSTFNMVNRHCILDWFLAGFCYQYNYFWVSSWIYWML